MATHYTRRGFIRAAALGGAAAAVGCSSLQQAVGLAPAGPIYRISLAQWAMNQSFTRQGGTLDNLDFPRVARENGYEAIEYVTQHFRDRARDQAYLTQLNRLAEENGLKHVLLMVDGWGNLSDPDRAVRTKAVEDHYQWIDAAKFMGAHAIRLNVLGGKGSFDEQLDAATDGYGRIVQYGADRDINVIIENHGGMSSDPTWLVALMRRVNNPYAGVLPDFGNFRKGEGTPAEYVDGYEAVRMLMPYQKGLSAKGNTRLANGQSVPVDVERMMRIALDAGFRGYVGIEYGGIAGIRAAREEYERVRTLLTPLYT